MAPGTRPAPRAEGCCPCHPPARYSPFMRRGHTDQTFLLGPARRRRLTVVAALLWSTGLLGIVGVAALPSDFEGSVSKWWAALHRDTSGFQLSKNSASAIGFAEVDLGFGTQPRFLPLIPRAMYVEYQVQVKVMPRGMDPADEAHLQKVGNFALVAGAVGNNGAPADWPPEIARMLQSGLPRMRVLNRTGLAVDVLYWAALLACVAAALVTRILLRDAGQRRRVQRGACAQCGYTRSGLDPSAPCPECGGPVKHREHPTPAPLS
jgi:hypothetical protein